MKLRKLILIDFPEINVSHDKKKKKMTLILPQDQEGQRMAFLKVEKDAVCENSNFVMNWIQLTL